jgi:hypothetical protein
MLLLLLLLLLPLHMFATTGVCAHKQVALLDCVGACNWADAGAGVCGEG